MSNWLTIIIVLLIVVILADGFRRSYSARQNRLGVSPSLGKRQKDSADAAEPDMLSGEFPNGGARVIGHRDPSRSSQPQTKAQTKAQEKSRAQEQAKALEKKLSSKDKRESRRRGEEATQRQPEQANLNLERSVPILMDSVKSEPVFSETETRHSDDERIEPTFSARTAPSALDNDDIDEVDVDYEDEELEEDYDEEEDFEEDYDDEDDDYEDEDDLEEPATQAQPEEVFIINVMAPKGKFFHGADLLDATLKCGLRYGNMDIFHRYSNTRGEGVLLFSMANMVKPGTFDLDAMDDFETPGVSLFMTLPIEADSMKSFDLMVDTANILAEALGGELKDEQRSAMTRQTIEHCRQRISDFERKKLFRRAK